MKMKVQRQTEAKPRFPGKEPARQIQGNSVEVRAAKLVESDIGQTHQCQRSQKVLAKLPVSHPRLSFLIPLERECVDEDRPPLVKLHVEGAAIFQRHRTATAQPLNIQGQ